MANPEAGHGAYGGGSANAALQQKRDQFLMKRAVLVAGVFVYVNCDFLRWTGRQHKDKIPLSFLRGRRTIADAEVLMAILERLRVFLDKNHAEYTHTEHPLAYTAREVASAEHLPAREVAKSVVIFGDGSYHLVLVPANRLVDFHEVRLALGLNQARMATEDELNRLFPDCELGAMPPFGSLYGIPVYLDENLAGEEILAFNAGTHRDVVHMTTAEFRRLTTPSIVSLAREAVMRHGW